MRITLTVNGSSRTNDVDPKCRLSHFLREALDLTGIKEGCCEGECGACTVLLDGKPVNSCVILAFQAGGCSITTIEGLAGNDGGMSALQQAFVDHGAVQCGYCTPGMILAAEGLLRENSNPDEAQIRHGLAGNICRCTGFLNIVRAVRSQASGALAETAP
jgi:aerobic-type carbon monoxide dehydrogenase small subunit (CoxS/CutS family)